MNNSPDFFHQIRLSNSSFKAANFNLQLLEFKSHSNVIKEYRIDMFNHLLSLESSTLPNLSLIQQQPEINLKMRPLLLDFLLDVINKLGLSKSTFPCTVNLIDRYCSTRIVKKQHYQLLGLTCLWISCKNLDSKYKIPNLSDLSKMCCNCYDKKLFLEMENHLLKSLGWVVSVPTFDSFIDLYLNLVTTFNNVSNQVLNDLKVLSLYICELIQFYPNIYFNYNTSLMSLTSLVISIKILNLNFNLNEFLKLLNSLIDVDDLNDSDSDTKTTDPVEHFTYSKFSNLSKLLVKILKCPPPSLKLKYFNENSKFIKLMEKLINFTNVSLEPMTPKSTSKLPPTPNSSNISPINEVLDNINLKNFKSSNQINCLPSPNSPQFVNNIHPPMVHPNDRKRALGTEGGDLKRSKSVPLLFIE
ncbi:hypothetical protein PSN45_003762 [Yamadazyma tenuis]|uniref:Cyclin-like domain-containing protein n=1 Tax=Candida tenuis (strain ATCC 10573 / BCRC 21748 / CBS 615 / JCM 9827 / NBRC 10315 / NRRL Y-1498 / VKM Y-70) TaxID=590646 RepID=G3B3C8_CANTC|nr:uncharacterized protein CANTEDRAFT_114161 [Yamadazyma tenuis ATCC 10573]XP_006686690.1 uncharacterized protein CANTEDRAFT_114161 [Yamadazyma tenuis ATCC 10573]EGV64375.1 hypothetical protein CANTEDRAFT_114161 [Yamadazyma tenuis ATCC 10573]EGV64376.1 hypothetical protein CANTEDRAFT_114161 [Yamadazyma tenuis ATCC 10573]WEJ96226.1 hypothetical protein PSN45_003762 [Yamadazyma tenuis]